MEEFVVPELPQTPAPEGQGQLAVPAAPEIDFASITGGRFNSADELNTYLAQQGDLQSRIAELEAAPKFANALHEKVNNLLGSGASVSEVQSFLELQSLNPKELAPLEAIRYAERHANPFLTAAELDAHIAEKYRIEKTVSGDGDIDPGESARLKLAHLEAVKSIEAQKVSAENPPSVQSHAAESAAKAQMEAAINSALAPVSFNQLSVVDGEYQFNFPVDENALKEAKTAAATIMQANGVTDPEQGKAIVENLLYFQLGRSMMLALAKDAAAKATEAAVKNMAGAPPQSSASLPPSSATGNNYIPIDKLMY